MIQIISDPASKTANPTKHRLRTKRPPQKPRNEEKSHNTPADSLFDACQKEDAEMLTRVLEKKQSQDDSQTKAEFVIAFSLQASSDAWVRALLANPLVAPHIAAADPLVALKRSPEVAIEVLTKYLEQTALTPAQITSISSTANIQVLKFLAARGMTLDTPALVNRLALCTSDINLLVDHLDRALVE